MNSDNKIWDDFIRSFKKNITKLHSENDLSPKLNKRTETTKFYKTELFSEIAKDLGMELSQREYLRVDITLSRLGKKGYPVPFVVVESENDSKGDLPNEIHKLLSLNAPLKILLTKLDSLDNDLKNEFDEHEDNHWYYPLNSFGEHKRLDGIFAVISCETSVDKLHFKYICYDKNGTKFGKDGFILE